MKLHVSLITVCALTVLPIVASAQSAPAVPSPSGGGSGTSSGGEPWLADRRYTEGPGYRVGNLEVHPGLAGGFGYDSNYLLRAPEDGDGTVPAALHLKITPSLSVSTLGQQRREA